LNHLTVPCCFSDILNLIPIYHALLKHYQNELGYSSNEATRVLEFAGQEVEELNTRNHTIA